MRIWLLLGASSMCRIFDLNFARQWHVMWVHVHWIIHYGIVEYGVHLAWAVALVRVKNRVNLLACSVLAVKVYHLTVSSNS